MTVWISGKIVKIMRWTDSLFSIIVNAPVHPFVAGQFVKIGLLINGVLIQRAYSYLNSPKNLNLEFYIVVIPGGRLTPFLYNLNPGDFVMLSQKSYGNFVLSKIPDCENLWMLASGTGISPYLSILDSGLENLARFSRIALVYATKYSQNLNYLSKMLELEKIYSGRLCIKVVLSQERVSEYLFGRLPDLIRDGILEEEVGLRLESKNSHVMLCGNPNMIRDTRKLLENDFTKDVVHGFKFDRKNFTQERYW